MHVVVVKNESLSDDELPKLADVSEENCYNCHESGWDVARWHDDENTFILLAKPVSESADASQEAVLKYF